MVYVVKHVGQRIINLLLPSATEGGEPVSRYVQPREVLRLSEVEWNSHHPQALSNLGMLRLLRVE